MSKRIIILVLSLLMIFTLTLDASAITTTGINSQIDAGSRDLTATSYRSTNEVAAIMASLPPNQAAEPGAWPMAAANPERTSWTPEEVRGDLKPLWYKHFTPYISQKVQIIAADGTLYVSTSGGLYALDAETGAEQWFYQTELPLGHSPTVYNGVVYVGGFDRKIHAINAATGTGLWTFEGGKGFHTNPLVVDVDGQTTIFAGNRDGYFYAIEDHSNSASLAWPPYKTDGPILYSAAYKNNTVYFASNDMHAYALNAQTGALVWKSAKLPSYGFHSWWPVIYRDYVVFNGGWNYRLVRPGPTPDGNHNILEGGDVYEDVSPGDYIGPLGTEPGDWAAGTTTINAFRATNYFEEKPWRRTTFILNRSNGQEYTFDYDNDDSQEYAPILYYGAKGGTRYPSAVGPDDVIYQANNYQSSTGTIPRGQVSGWKLGTPFISIPSASTNAVDEPLAFSIGGNVVYTRLCCDREAKAFDLVTGQSWTYYDQGGNTLRSYVPDLFAEGWPYGYWKHGDPSPPIPYNGKVYIIANNAVVALSPDGGDPVIPPGEDLGADTGQSPDDIERSTVVTGLNTKVTSNNTSWPLLIQQETYYNISPNSSARARYFPLFEIAGSTSSPTSLSEQSTNIATILSSTFAGGQSLTTRISTRTPSILFETTGNTYTLDGSLAGIAYPTTSGVTVATGSSTINGVQLSEGWVLIWDSTDTHRWTPVVLSFQNRPSQLVFNSAGLDISFSGAGGYLAVTPLYGMSDPKSEEENSWLGGIPQDTVERIRLLNRTAHSFPIDVAETWSINSGSGDASFTYTYSYIEFSDDWSTQAQRVAYVPPRMALAAWNNSPIRINEQPLAQHLDFEYMTPLGRVAGVPNASAVTVRLPGIANYWREILDTPEQASPTDPVQMELVAQIQAMLDAGHLRPGYGRAGIWDAGARGHLGNNLADLWHSPADTIYPLLRALPILPTSMQQDVRQYVQNEFQAYPPYSTSHIGWANGAPRDRFDLPPEVDADRVNFTACDSHCNNGWDLAQENFYAMWMYAEEFGGASSIFANAQSEFDTSPEFNQSMPYVLNTYIAGYVGYLKLGQLAGQGWQQNIEKTLIELLILKAASMRYPSALEETGFEYGGYMWSVRTYAPNYPDTMFNVATIGTLWSQMPLYGFRMDPRYGLYGGYTGGGYSFGIDFVNLTPELAHFMYDYAFAEVEALVSDYETRNPYWFVADAEEMAGEGVLRPLYDTIALFQAKAQILGEERTELEKYLDVPAYAVGDLFYIQKLTDLLEEGGYTGIADFTLNVSSSTQEIDPGGTANYTVQIGAIGTYTSTITLMTSSPSPTLTLDLVPTTIITTPDTATLTVSYPSSNVLWPGLWYTIPITGSDDRSTKSTNASLHIRPNDFSNVKTTYIPIILNGY